MKIEGRPDLLIPLHIRHNWPENGGELPDNSLRGQLKKSRGDINS